MGLDLRLTKFRQTIKEVSSTPAYSIAQFSGASPILVLKDTTFVVIVQSGEAVAWGYAFIPPAPLTDGVLLEQPEINVERGANTKEWKTTWNYVMAFDSAPTLSQKMAAENWPTAPTFQAVP